MLSLPPTTLPWDDHQGMHLKCLLGHCFWLILVEEYTCSISCQWLFISRVAEVVKYLFFIWSHSSTNFKLFFYFCIYWTDPEKINSIEHLVQIEDSLRESLDQVQTHKVWFPFLWFMASYKVCVIVDMWCSLMHCILWVAVVI